MFVNPSFCRVGPHKDFVSEQGFGLINARIRHGMKRFLAETDDPEEARFLLQFDSRPVMQAGSQQIRIIVDHAQIGDAGFWIFDAHRLRRQDVLLVSSGRGLRMLQRLFLNGPRMLHLPYCVDTELFTPGPSYEDRTRRSRQVLLFGHPNSLKRVDLSLRFFAALVSAPYDLDLHLCFVASDEYKGMAEWRTLVEELGIQPRVTFRDVVSHTDMPELYRDSAVLVHFSTGKIENFGMVVAESLACGTPVIASDWGGFGDTVEPGVHGLLAPTWFSDAEIRVDWESLLEPAAQLLQTPDVWRGMSERGRERVASRFSVAAYDQRIAASFDRLSDHPGNAAHVDFSDDGEQLIMNTFLAYLKKPAPRTTGEEFRRLWAYDSGRSAWLLRGDQASHPPRWA